MHYESTHMGSPQLHQDPHKPSYDPYEFVYRQAQPQTQYRSVPGPPPPPPQPFAAPPGAQRVEVQRA